MRAMREFHCLDCDVVYEEFASYDENGQYPDVECPECKSKKKEYIFGVPSFNFTNPVGTGRWNNAAQGHDYRYKWNLPNVHKQREYAEKNSHVGPRPYIHHDDISSGKNFDPEQW
jgi:hypothetical protein